MYHIFPVNPLLADLIDCFWESNFQILAPEEIYCELYVAQFNPNLIINLSESYHCDAIKIEASRVVTVNTRALQFTHAPSNHLFGIRFRPGGLRIFSPLGMHELIDELPTAVDILGKDWLILEEKIRNSKTASERITHTESWLLQRMDSRKLEKYRLTQQIQQCIVKRAHEKDCISKLESQLFLSNRSIDRYFQEFLGLSPKRMSRLVRFEQAFAHLNTSKSDFEFLDFGYYDAAHFSKEFRYFAGMSMLNYLNSDFFVQNLQNKHFETP